MKKVVKEFNVFSFKELNEDIQKKVKDKISNDLVNNRFYFLEDDLCEICHEKYGLENVHLHYSFSYSQGDGLCFELDDFLKYDYKNKCLSKTNVFEQTLEKELNKTEKSLLYKYINDGYVIKIEKSIYNYEYCKTCKITYEIYHNSDYKLQEQVNNILERVKDILDSVYESICLNLEKIGYSYYDIGDDDIMEEIEENNYEFLSDGSIF